MWELILPFIGFLVAFVAAMIGVGGGVFIVPLLTLAYAFTPAHAIGTSLLVIFFVGLSATMSYSRHKLVFFKVGLLLAVATIPGSLLGAYLTSILPGAVLGLIFGVFLIAVAIRMLLSNNLFYKKKFETDNVKAVWSESEVLAEKRRFVAAFGLCFFGGLVSALLGIGGGLVFVPVLALVLFLPIHVVVATSMFTMVFTSSAGVVQHWSLGNVNLEFGILLAVGAVAGALVGSWVCKRVSDEKLQAIFAVALILLSVQMILKFI
ncbi:MAG TPA: sulfite exporter TauE/SafE family protein [Candidatus Nanoarchaeia archaeon]|nr:sulfite exporter TauE/SafE family protein [Candidatus Nanoarchaeia archaeon]